MKKTIPAIVLTLFLALLPFSVADKMYLAYPGSTSSPMVKVPTPQARYMNGQDLAQIRQGLPVLVYGQTPETLVNPSAAPQNSLFIDEYGVLVNPQGNPVVRGTTGYSFANGYDWTALYPWNRLGSYFTSNLRGFKAGVAQTNWVQHGGRTWGVYMYGGYDPARAVIKQWYKPRTETTGYFNPGLSKLITTQPTYVRPGIPGWPVPSAAEEKVTITQKIQQADREAEEKAETQKAEAAEPKAETTKPAVETTAPASDDKPASDASSDDLGDLDTTQ